ncbi:MAG: ankyrin repeat domain-containing protein, partial [Okeania sp. SIO2B9]|nr:ankyrin repeat domain-containing protein [Okeania sp. SIO2B9]
MHIIRRIEQILIDLRPVFSRDATYEWFVILIWGILLCSQHRAVTSDLNAVGLTQNYYTQALHWFHSKGISVQKLSTMWHKWLITHPKVHLLRGQPVYVGDGIKVGKEGKKMPGVKKLHNESENVTKPDEEFEEGQTALMYAVSSFWAQNRAEVVRFLVSRGAD